MFQTLKVQQQTETDLETMCRTELPNQTVTVEQIQEWEVELKQIADSKCFKTYPKIWGLGI